MGATEFSSIAKGVFVQVASEEYGLRGRPTNASRIAAMTGLSRKEVAKIRSISTTPPSALQQLTTPLNEVLHYWHSDPDFSTAEGEPRVLALSGDRSFETLATRYAGDIPAGAIRRELEVRGAATVTNEQTVTVHKRFVHAAALDEEFLRHLSFSLEGLCTTLVHNADLVERIREGSNESHESDGRLERVAWTGHMTAEEIERFRMWVRQEGSEFIERADARIGDAELPRRSWKWADDRTVGVGLYYFEIT